jgi:hypothetical protein
MTAQKEIYKGLEMLFDDRNHELVIDNRKILLSAVHRKFFTPYLPYTSYDSIRDLAMAVIDFVPSFYTKTRKSI